MFAYAESDQKRRVENDARDEKKHTVDADKAHSKTVVLRQ